MPPIEPNIEDYRLGLKNCYYRLRFVLEQGLINRFPALKRNRQLKDRHAGETCFIVGNGPSLKQQDLTKLQGKTVFMVNRAFLLEEYKIIQPNYHFIVDPKLFNGQWSLDFLDQAHEKNPNVEFFLHVTWLRDTRFQEIDKKFKVHWIFQNLNFTPFFSNRKIDLSWLTYSNAVVEQAITAAIYMGFQKIYYLGVDGTGLAYNILKRQDSHVYGFNPEDQNMNPDQMIEALGSASRSLYVWKLLHLYCQHIGVELVNLTHGGILDFDRDSFDRVLGE